MGSLNQQFENLLLTNPETEFVNVASMRPAGNKRFAYKYHHVTGSAKSGEGFLTEGLQKVLQLLVSRKECPKQRIRPPRPPVD